MPTMPMTDERMEWEPSGRLANGHGRIGNWVTFESLAKLYYEAGLEFSIWHQADLWGCDAHIVRRDETAEVRGDGA